MAINFPSNPNINDTFIVSGTIFTWTGVKWKSTAVTEISSDTSPELSGTLDLNNNDITGTGNINVTGIITATSFSGNGANLTNLSSAQLTGALPAIDGSNLISGRWTLGANGTSDYTFTGIGFTQTTNDPTLYLKKGEVYEFVNNSGGAHPFQIRESNGGAAYNNGVTNNGAASGTITFEVPYNAPDSLYYQCMNHPNMGGDITILGGGAGVGTETSINTTGIITASAFYGDGSGLTFAPKIIAFDPAALSTGIAADTNITITFDQDIQFAGTGTVELRSTTNSGTIIESFAITSGSAASGLSISGTQLIINPTSSLSDNTVVYVILPSQGIANLTGTYYAGSNNYNFQTVPNTFSAQGGDYVYTLADGGSPTGYYKYHIFTSSGILTTTSASQNSDDLAMLMIAGGGSGGNPGSGSGLASGGGGAGGLVSRTQSTLVLSAGTYTITIGGGGAGQIGAAPGAQGIPSKLSPPSPSDPVILEAIGGGYGNYNGTATAAGPGGSGGGFGSNPGFAGGGTGTPGQGYPGGNCSPNINSYRGSGGGGGAGGVGGTGSPGTPAAPLGFPNGTIYTSGSGGNGSPVPTFNTSVLSGYVPDFSPTVLTDIGPTGLYAGGGGGSTPYLISPGIGAFAGSGGPGGGGAGGQRAFPGVGIPAATSAENGSSNTGGGGGAGSPVDSSSGAGGSGVFMIRYSTTAP